MNRTFIIAATIGVIATSSMAIANDSNDYPSGSDYGTVVKLDRAGKTITLANGTSYDVLFPGDLKNVRVGEKVRITFSDGAALSISR